MATLLKTIARHGITLPADQIADLCREHDVLELAVFGSFLREDFGLESDIDFLAVFKNDDLGPWMGKLQRLETRLSRCSGGKSTSSPRGTSRPVRTGFAVITSWAQPG